MAPKRAADVSGPSAGTAKKRARMKDQRIIQVQKEASRAGRIGGSASSGTTGLPPTIDVEKFAQARAFEITAMQNAMHLSKELNTQRAFQSLPRHLRRRAASHNVRRLPLRLREKAKSETPKDAAKPKARSRKMLGKKKPKELGSHTQMLRKRQRTKIWLETHIWHAKRMHMTEIWGHRLAYTPTMKAFRASYRASFHGALLHDASYFQYMELTGPLEGLLGLLKLLCGNACDGNGVSITSKRYTTGARECHSLLYNFNCTYPYGLIGPMTIIWNPSSKEVPKTSSNDEPTSNETPSTITYRTILLRFHPSMCVEALESIAAAIQRTGFRGRPILYEKELLTFEICGRRATEVVKAVIRPILQNFSSDSQYDCKAKENAWKMLSSPGGPHSVPRDVVLGLMVHDPRLDFPPKLDKSSAPALPGKVLIPSSSLAENSDFWSSKKRRLITKPRFKQEEINSRRAENLIPGTRVLEVPDDDRIPILLAQYNLGPSSADTEEGVAGWRLTIPAGWGMAFWMSLVFSETRIGGLKERSHMYFEAGAPRFPEDFPGTAAFYEYEKRREVEEKGYWERRPPAKRPNYSKLGTTSPFRADFESILTSAWRSTLEAGGDSALAVEPWLVSPSVALAIAQEMSTEKSIHADASRFLRQWRDGLWEKDLASALIRVRMYVWTRGAPEDLGLLYKISDTNWEEAQQKLPKTRRKKIVLPQVECEDSQEDICASWPGVDEVIGRTLAGSYSLKRGEGYAIGAICLSELMRLLERDKARKGAIPLLALVRNRDSQVYRAVSLEIMT